LARQTDRNYSTQPYCVRCVAPVLRTRGLRGAYALLREMRVIGGLGGHELHRTLEQRHLDDRVEAARYTFHSRTALSTLRGSLLGWKYSIPTRCGAGGRAEIGRPPSSTAVATHRVRHAVPYAILESAFELCCAVQPLRRRLAAAQRGGRSSAARAAATT
jgi:hypothetical protein